LATISSEFPKDTVAVARNLAQKEENEMTTKIAIPTPTPTFNEDAISDKMVELDKDAILGMDACDVLTDDIVEWLNDSGDSYIDDRADDYLAARIDDLRTEAIGELKDEWVEKHPAIRDAQRRASLEARIAEYKDCLKTAKAELAAL
jgi:hypothetical protein